MRYDLRMAGSALLRRTISNVTLEAVLGDLTEEPVDAIVNPANAHLEHGGGLAGAIVRAGGQCIQDESRRIAPVPVGAARATSAGTLPCRWVIHAVGPRWGEGDEANKLARAVEASLECATELGASSIAMPAISTGIFGYPKREGCATIVSTAVSWLASAAQTPLSHIRFTAFDRPTADLFTEALNMVTPA
jgi:O-acetyl-ADP-ribose deacetylase (regulator of RNase III)